MPRPRDRKERYSHSAMAMGIGGREGKKKLKCQTGGDHRCHVSSGKEIRPSSKHHGKPLKDLRKINHSHYSGFPKTYQDNEKKLYEEHWALMESVLVHEEARVSALETTSEFEKQHPLPAPVPWTHWLCLGHRGENRIKELSLQQTGLLWTSAATYLSHNPQNAQQGGWRDSMR